MGEAETSRARKPLSSYFLDGNSDPLRSDMTDCNWLSCTSQQQPLTYSDPMPMTSLVSWWKSTWRPFPPNRVRTEQGRRGSFLVASRKRRCASLVPWYVPPPAGSGGHSQEITGATSCGGFGRGRWKRERPVWEVEDGGPWWETLA